jgi:hypothetical protein
MISKYGVGKVYQKISRTNLGSPFKNEIPGQMVQVKY